MNRVFKSNSERETMVFARELGTVCKSGDVICLSGVAGAGKTHFVKGFVEAFGLSRNVVNSPTFTLIHEYQGSVPIYHFDCYRLKNASEALAIGAEEYFYGEGVSIIEWPDRIRDIIPDNIIRVRIKVTGRTSRSIVIGPDDEYDLPKWHPIT